jgi:hypothetical protein
MSSRCQKWRIEVSVHFGRKILILRKKTEDRRPKTGDRRPKTEDRRKKKFSQSRKLSGYADGKPQIYAEY